MKYHDILQQLSPIIVLAFDDQVCFLTTQWSKPPFFTQERGYNSVWEECYLKAVICRSRGGFLANEGKKKNTSKDKPIIKYVFNISFLWRCYSTSA